MPKLTQNDEIGGLLGPISCSWTLGKPKVWQVANHENRKPPVGIIFTHEWRRVEQKRGEKR